MSGNHTYIQRMAAAFFLLTVTVASWAFPLGGLDHLMECQQGETHRASSSDPNWQNGNGDARPIPPGETLVIAELEGPGVVRHIWNTIATGERCASRLVVIRMYWDGEENPSVECPLGDFFGMGHGLDVPFTSLPITVTSGGKARNCYWPMPFRKSAKITVTNEGRAAVHAFFWYVDWQKLPRMKRKTPYFHAAYRQEHPTVSGRNYLLADIEGRGHYVGTVQSVRQHTPSWWGKATTSSSLMGKRSRRCAAPAVKTTIATHGASASTITRTTASLS